MRCCARQNMPSSLVEPISSRSRRSCSPFLDDTWRSNVKSDPFSNLWRMTAASPFPLMKLQRYGTGKSIPQPSEKFGRAGRSSASLDALRLTCSFGCGEENLNCRSIARKRQTRKMRTPHSIHCDAAFTSFPHRFVEYSYNLK